METANTWIDTGHSFKINKPSLVILKETWQNVSPTGIAATTHPDFNKGTAQFFAIPTDNNYNSLYAVGVQSSGTFRIFARTNTAHEQAVGVTVYYIGDCEVT